MRNYVALAFSFFFYAWGAPRFIFVVVASCVFDWVLTNRMYASGGTERKKWYLRAVVVQNVLILAYFKYIDFGIASANSALGFFGIEPMPLLQVALPIGISFITFEKITYVVDVYRGVGKPAPRLSTYLLYVHYFPQLIAGPIIQYHDIESQFERRKFGLDNAVVGMSRFSIGLAKKVLIADALAPTADAAFSLPPDQLDPISAWIGITCFTMQIYFDFSGYSDMAIGIARTMGFRFLENFDQPYISRSITEFWQRWHISLGNWIRTYVYIPLGGNRNGPTRTYLNLWLCFFLCGLWHGAAITFVAWGIYQGSLLIIERVYLMEVLKRFPVWLAISAQFFLTMIGWVIFRSEDMSQVSSYLGAMIPNGTMLFARIGHTLPIALDWEIGVHLAVALMIAFAPAMRRFQSLTAWLALARYRDEAMTAAALVLFALSVGRIAGAAFSPFLYFRF
jgi:alginate O-acetyltransferase complex protein AlgI